MKTINDANMGKQNMRGRPPGTKNIQKRKREEINITSYNGKIGRPAGATGIPIRKRYNFTLSDETASLLNSLSSALGLSKSSVVENAVSDYSKNKASK
jgi:hypothetical protein